MSPQSTGNKMSVSTNAIDLGAPTATWLRAHRYSAKRVARVIGASEGTGKRLRAGVTPTADQMAKLSQHFGWPFVKHVFAAVIGPSDDELDRDLLEIKARLSRLENANAFPHEARPPVLPMESEDLDAAR